MAFGSLSRQLRNRPRLWIAIAAGLVLWVSTPASLSQATRTILSLDLGALVFLGLTWHMMAASTRERMRLRARMQDEGRVTILLLTVGAAVISLAAIAVELRQVKDLPAGQQLAHIGLAAATIICSWLVTHTMFALHYAHTFYDEGEGEGKDHAGGLEFPGAGHPDYWDFLYFSFVIGMTGQTSDVQIASRKMRRLCLGQGVLAFFFNTVILALSINIAAGLL
ncbi:DUF1345 domain-containing protein [Telmatospirillum sp.]|uniref:DUF1345 domain-containing protein n=1 Tax=Telmatospirillum sp. TaxID=2079197 RepID=UPI002843C1AA|nr:DUF1345 domain-containing protein [Telmatospirillum sp.]MDR3437615.1 DUF1345 domain-containing protein [Telmatospirillum sp.]